MKTHNRIHIFGASGSGTTTLGKALADSLHIRHLDADDFFWAKTEIPYTVPRPVTERIALLRNKLMKEDDWVLSGALHGWGDFTIPMFTLVIFLWIPHDLRMQRLKEREIVRYGLEAISPGGWFHNNHLEFMDWAAQYDTGGIEMRSRLQHEQWMRCLPCRQLRFEEPLSTADMVEKTTACIESIKKVNHHAV